MAFVVLPLSLKGKHFNQFVNYELLEGEEVS
jgi:hypothetical protein